MMNLWWFSQMYIFPDDRWRWLPTFSFEVRTATFGNPILPPNQEMVKISFLFQESIFFFFHFNLILVILDSNGS
jgi:hypothetical protein